MNSVFDCSNFNEKLLVDEEAEPWGCKISDSSRMYLDPNFIFHLFLVS